MRRSIDLPRSRARSRTSRGSLLQAVPIGCIRVFMTPSCRSLVICESRCTGKANDASLLPPADLQQLIARQHQLAHERHEVFEHPNAYADRLLAQTAIGYGTVGRAAHLAGLLCRDRLRCSEHNGWRRRRVSLFSPVCGRICCRLRGWRRFSWLGKRGPFADRLQSRDDRESSPDGSSPVLASAATISFMASAAWKTVVTSGGVAVSDPSRSIPKTFSAACATFSSRARPRNPQVPLIVCTSRKIKPTEAASPGVRSRTSSASSRPARLSVASVRNSDSRSSMCKSFGYSHQCIVGC